MEWDGMVSIRQHGTTRISLHQEPHMGPGLYLHSLGNEIFYSVRLESRKFDSVSNSKRRRREGGNFFQIPTTTNKLPVRFKVIHFIFFLFVDYSGYGWYSFSFFGWEIFIQRYNFYLKIIPPLHFWLARLLYPFTIPPKPSTNLVFLLGQRILSLIQFFYPSSFLGVSLSLSPTLLLCFQDVSRKENRDQ